METIEAVVPRRCPEQIHFPGFEIGRDDTVVDVGCGPGDVCLYAASKGAKVVGIDYDESLIERLRTTADAEGIRGISGIVSDANPIPLPDGFASVVVATEVLEHVDEPAVFLAELARIGKPGARYLISVPDPASEGVMAVVAPGWYWEKPLHIRVFDRETLDRAVRDSGLLIVSRRSTGFYWSMHWICRMAIGMAHKYDPAPPHAIFDHLEGFMAELLATRDGQAALQALDELVPKSQVLIARKPLPHEIPRTSRLRKFLKSGSITIGGFDLRWQLQRSA